MDTRAKDLISEALGKIHEMADANTVMGDPIKVDGITIIPVSKVSYGFAGGGSDLPVKSEKEAFGGGTGGGMTLQPLGFLVVSNGDVKFIQINLNFVQMFQSLDVKLLLNWNINKLTNYNRYCSVGLRA